MQLVMNWYKNLRIGYSGSAQDTPEFDLILATGKIILQGDIKITEIPGFLFSAVVQSVEISFKLALHAGAAVFRMLLQNLVAT